MPRHTDPKLVEQLKAMGCEIEPGRKHRRITYKGYFIAPLSGSPSDTRSSLNTLSGVRRNIRELRERGVIQEEGDVCPS
jgi:hypothetical protein